LKKRASEVKRNLPKATSLDIVASEEPGKAIKLFAREHQPNLLVVASRDLGSVKRHLLGSVSDYLVHHCRIPVLVVKENAQTELNNPKKHRDVVLAVDDSENSLRAFNWVLDNSLSASAKIFLTIVNVARKGFESDSRKLLNKYLETCKSKGFEKQSTAKQLSGPKPGKAIADLTTELEPDLLVVSSRGRGAISRQLLGSTSDFLVHNVKCAILIYKDQFTNPKPTKGAGTGTVAAAADTAEKPSGES